MIDAAVRFNVASDLQDRTAGTPELFILASPKDLPIKFLGLGKNCVSFFQYICLDLRYLFLIYFEWTYPEIICFDVPATHFFTPI